MLAVAGSGLLLGPVVGMLMLLTSASFDFVNLVSATIYVVTLPFVAVVTTYLYFDLLVRERLAPERADGGEALPGRDLRAMSLTARQSLNEDTGLTERSGR